VRALIQDCCESFNRNYCDPDAPQVDCRPENGHRFLVKRTIPRDGQTIIRDISKSVLIEFNEAEESIRVTPSDKAPLVFSIQSDETRAFLAYNKQEITADELSEKSLEDLFFGKASGGRPATRNIRSGPRDWMG